MARERSPEEGALLRAMANMPFGALVSTRLGGRERDLSLEGIARYLDTLADVLRDHVSRCEEEHRCLVQLNDDIAALRRVLGTGASS